MILINLLPHREIARKKRRDAFNVGLASSALVGGIMAGMIFLWFQAHISTQQSRNRVLQTEIDKFNEQIKDIAGLQSQIAALVARQQAVEDLQSDRNLPVHLLSDMVRLLPEGVYIQSLRQEGQNVLLQGVAQSNERVSELLRNFSNQSRWFAKPDLVEIVTGMVALSPRDTRRVANFSLRVKLVRASEQNADKASAPSKPADKSK